MLSKSLTYDHHLPSVAQEQMSNASSITETITLAEHPEKQGVGFLGVVIETPVRADVPFEITIDVGNVRGPSAGLAFRYQFLMS